MKAKIEKRKRSFPEEVMLKVVEHVGNGCSIKIACYACGVKDPDTLKAHCERNPALKQKFEEAKAKFVVESLHVIAHDLPGHIGRKWILERRHWQEFAKQSADVQVNVVQNNSSQTLVLNAETLEEMARIGRRYFTNEGKKIEG